MDKLKIVLTGQSFIISRPCDKATRDRLLRDFSPETVDWICSGGAEKLFRKDELLGGKK